MIQADDPTSGNILRPNFGNSDREILTGFTPNTQQSEAIARVGAFLAGSDRLFLLAGYAGTGKTTTIQAIIKLLRDKGDSRRIVFTAFTNKAVKVLEKMVRHWQLDIECMTLCRLLGLKIRIDQSTGRQRFEPDYGVKNAFGEFDLIVIDECSMLDKEIWQLVTDELGTLFSERETQVLCIGDPAQLPPVNEKESPCFGSVLEQHQLTEVVRYGGAIAILAEQVRLNLDNPGLVDMETDMTGDRAHGVYCGTPAQWQKKLIRAFTSDKARQDPDYVRALCYTNRRVDAVNATIRAALYGKDVPRFVEGERLVADSPYTAQKSTLMATSLATSTECKVLEIRAGRSDGWNIWSLRVSLDGEAFLTLTIEILHESEFERFEKACDDLAKAKNWKAFYCLKERFAQMKYAYCLTVHKSQGSTFQNVFVDVNNLLANRVVRERNQLLYVAATRAAKRLFLSC